jgi:hypothetical protein
VMLRWETSLPIKQAIVRASSLGGAGISPDTEQFLTRQETQYVVSIVGLQGRMLGRDRVASLKVKGKDPIPATDIKPATDQAKVYLIFARSSPITLEDQEVEVSFKSGGIEIKHKFKLKDMVFDGKLDL